MNFNICLVQPQGYVHSAAFSELAEVLCYGLQELGHKAGVTLNNTFVDARNIIIGCHLLDPSYMGSVPGDTIIVNTEQLTDDHLPWHDNIYQWVARFQTWDYSARNLEKLRTVGAANPKLLRLGFHRKLARIDRAATQDIDVLFYGSIGERRRRILLDLHATRRNVAAVFGVYGTERDRLISRAKIVLNVHHYNSKIFEIVRVFYLMTNSKAVVSEVGEDTAIDRQYAAGIWPAKYDELVTACLKLLADDQLRRDLEKRALEAISGLPQGELLQPLLD